MTIDARRRTLLAAASGAASLAAGGVASLAAIGAQADDGLPALGTVLKLPPVRLLDGRELMPDYWRGKVLVVERWATWCPFCANQNPHIDKLHRANAERGLEVLGLSIDRGSEVVRTYMRDRNYAFHVAMMTPAWDQALGKTRKLPVVWVVGRDGRLKEIIPGEMFPDDVEGLVKWMKS